MEEFKLYSCDNLKHFLTICLADCSSFSKTKTHTIFHLHKYDHLLSKNNYKKACISNYDFNEIYEQFKKYSIFDNLILYSSNYIEIPIQFNGSDYFYDLPTIQPYPFNLNDKNNEINYQISSPSPEYGMLLLNYLNSFHEKDKNIFHFYSITHRWRDFLISRNKSKKIINTYNILQTFNGNLTLKIKLKKNNNLEYLQTLYHSFRFQFMLHFNTFFKYDLDIRYILNTYGSNVTKNYNANNFSLQNQIYKEHIIDYYSLALSSNETFAQYLSYYHVLEYFFNEVFNQYLRKQLQDKITSSNFNNQDSRDLDKIINFIKKETRDCKENGQGNELESLKLVLTKFIEIDELQEKLTPEQIEYYQLNKIKFSNAPTVSFKDKQNFYIHLAQRIYQTRNALVHSKEGNVGRYKPYQDNEELQKEIPLIKLVAEQVIINSSTPL